MGNRYFSEYISFTDNKTIVIATLLLFAIGIIYGIAMLISFMLIPVGIGCITSIPLILGVFFITPISLWLLNNHLPGFEIHGFWTYVVMTLILNMVKVQLKAEQEKKE